MDMRSADIDAVAIRRQQSGTKQNQLPPLAEKNADRIEQTEYFK
jgi:hypothetical protein